MAGFLFIVTNLLGDWLQKESTPTVLLVADVGRVCSYDDPTWPECDFKKRKHDSLQPGDAVSLAGLTQTMFVIADPCRADDHSLAYN